jgi:hypothetical protein
MDGVLFCGIVYEIMSYSDINHETILPSVRRIPKGDYDFDELKLRFGTNLDDDFIEKTVMHEDMSDGVITFKPEHAVTTQRLRGSVRKLSANSLIRVQGLAVPFDMRPQQVEAMMYGRSSDMDNKKLEKIYLGSLTITEPKVPRFRTQRLPHFFIRRNPAELVPLISDGLENYLNGGLLAQERIEELRASVGQAQLHMSNISTNENDYLRSFIASFEDDPSRQQD